MSDYTRIVQELMVEEWPGRMPQLHFKHLPGRCVAIIEARHPVRGALALGVGADHGEACRMLLRQLSSAVFTLSAEEVARVLGITRGAVRQRVARGTLRPVIAGAGPMAARFAPGDVAAADAYLCGNN